VPVSAGHTGYRSARSSAVCGTFKYPRLLVVSDASLGGPKRQRGPIQGGKQSAGLFPADAYPFCDTRFVSGRFRHWQPLHVPSGSVLHTTESAFSRQTTPAWALAQVRTHRDDRGLCNRWDGCSRSDIVYKFCNRFIRGFTVACSSHARAGDAGPRRGTRRGVQAARVTGRAPRGASERRRPPDAHRHAAVAWGLDRYETLVAEATRRS
jgi:hypothetical protein